MTQIDNGNSFVFCDHVDDRYRGCVRGAGHNGPHAVCLPPYPLGPVLLVDPAPSPNAEAGAVDAATSVGAQTSSSLVLSSSSLRTLKRYDLITNYRAGSSIEEMEPSDDGEWVRYEQVAALLSPVAVTQISNSGLYRCRACGWRLAEMAARPASRCFKCDAYDWEPTEALLSPVEGRQQVTAPLCVDAKDALD